MSGQLRFVFTKDDVTYSKIIYTGHSEVLLSHFSLWTSNWGKYNEILKLFNINTKENISSNIEPIQYGLVNVNWDTKEIYSTLRDYSFTEFKVFNFYCELTGLVLYEDSFPVEHETINLFLDNLVNKTAKNYITCNIVLKNNEKLKTQLNIVSSFESPLLIDFFINSKKIERNPTLLSKYKFLELQNVDINNIKSLDFRAFPLNTNEWNYKHSKNSEITI